EARTKVADAARRFRAERVHVRDNVFVRLGGSSRLTASALGALALPTASGPNAEGRRREPGATPQRKAGLSPATEKHRTLSLVFILYFSTSGGPHTVESLVHEIGPGMAALMLLLVPLLWSVPEVLIVGELSSMLPVEGGYYRWVDRAFGKFWAFQNGWLTY